jgi:hypothetical protein
MVYPDYEQSWIFDEPVVHKDGSSTDSCSIRLDENTTPPSDGGCAAHPKKTKNLSPTR